MLTLSNISSNNRVMMGYGDTPFDTLTISGGWS